MREVYLGVQIPLRSGAGLLIQFLGDIRPGPDDYKQAHKLLDWLESGGGPEEQEPTFHVEQPAKAAPAVTTLPTRAVQTSTGKTRLLKTLGPCPKCGGTERHAVTNRCTKCLRGKRGQDAKPEARTGLDDGPELPRQPGKRVARVIWSESLQCPMCGERASRLHRSAKADFDKEYWVHDKPKGKVPCLIPLKGTTIKDDLAFTEDEAAEVAC